MDSSVTDANDRYYRYWTGDGNTAASCENSATEAFGNYKGLDIWALERTPNIIEDVEIIPAANTVDVTTLVSVSGSTYPGDIVYGNIVYSHAGGVGSGDATNVVYTATIGTPGSCPAGVALTLLPPGLTYSYNSSTCAVTFTGMPTTLTPGQTLNFNFEYTAPGFGPIPTNTSIGSTEDPLPGIGAPNTAAAQTIVLLPAAVVVKSADPASGTTVTTGQTITYTIEVAVSGAALSADMVLNDTLAPGLSFDSVTFPGLYSCAAFASPMLTCTLPSGTGVGTHTLQYTATVTATSGSVDNNVTAAGGGVVPELDCSVCSTTHNLPVPVVSVEKSSNPVTGTTVAAGNTISYTLSAVVTDAALTSDLILTDTLGTGLTFGSVTSAGDYAADTSAAPILVFTLPSGTIPGTYAVTYTVTVDNDATGSVGNVVIATGGGPDDPDCTTGETEHPLEASVSLLKELVEESGNEPGVAEPGEQLTYTITLTNSGGEDATAFGVSDQLDDQMIFASADNGGTHAAGVVTWSGLTVPANGTLVLTVIVTVVDPIPAGITEIRNLAWPTGTPAPPCDDDYDGCVITPVAATPQIAVHKTVDVAYALPGDTVVYMISVQNIGTVDVVGLTISDPMPAGIASFDWDCTANGGATCPTGSGTGALSELVPLLPVGGQLVYTIAAVVEDDASAIALNVVTVTPDEFARCEDGSEAPCDASASVDLRSQPVDPVKIPATSPWALLLLMLGLGGLALRLGRRRLT